jgi:hypothetical protein
MKNKFHKKAIVFGIIIILFCSTIFPGISSKKVKPEKDEIINDKKMEAEEELATLTFNTFNENGKKENKIELPISKAKYIFNLFEKLRNMTISHPNSQETLDLKNRFIDLLKEYELIPSGMSTSDIQPLINPHASPDNSGSRGRTGFLRLIFEILFSNRFNHLRLLEPLDYPSDWSIVCNVAGGGYGIPLPLFIIPRPRFITVWGATFATTAVGSLLMPKSFVAIGNQQGICLGFVGVGLTIAFFGFMGYGMLGYSLYTAVRAQEIERYNNEPTITNENPPSGSMNVPISLSELSFRLTDGDGDLMSYSVTTSPNIGSGSANNKGNGVYGVPVSGLDSDTDYTWHVSVDDGYDIVDKTFTFRTEAVAPVISNPNPPDGAMDVSVDLSELSFYLKDYQGDLMDYTVTTNPNIGSGSGNGVGDGTYTVDISGLDYSTEYKWYVTATDGVHQTTKEFSFQTEHIMVFDPFEMGWQYRKKITIDHTKVDGNLENFPVLISLTDPDLSDKAQNDGDDILFMDGPGVANRLYHEIEYYEDSNGELVAWVNIPSLSSNEDTILYLYYGNPSCSSQQFPDEVWDSDYIHVWHLGDNLKDSAGSDNGNNHGTSKAYGKIGEARDFERDDHDFIDFGDMAQPGDGSLTTMTWEAWIKPESIDTVLTTKYNTQGTDYNSYFISFLKDGEFRICAYSAVGINTNGFTDDSYSVVGEWIYLTGTFNLGGTNKLNIFIDGNEVPITQTSNSANVMKNIPVTDDLGRYRPEAGTKYADGVFDEVRWSKTVRSDDWIITSYKTMNDPSSFFNVSPEESAP